MNITQQLEEYQAEESDIGPALHAARQVAYWSSVFVLMISGNPISVPITGSNHHATSSITTTTITSSPTTAATLSTVISSHQQLS